MVPTNMGARRSRKAAPFTSATRRTMRSFSSAAARSVKVKATMEAGLRALLDKGGDAAGDRLRLPGAGTGDDLKVGAAVRDDLLLGGGEGDQGTAAG